jgi:hypothetical protein
MDESVASLSKACCLQLLDAAIAVPCAEERKLCLMSLILLVTCSGCGACWSLHALWQHIMQLHFAYRPAAAAAAAAGPVWQLLGELMPQQLTAARITHCLRSLEPLIRWAIKPLGHFSNTARIAAAHASTPAAVMHLLRHVESAYAHYYSRRHHRCLSHSDACMLHLHTNNHTHLNSAGPSANPKPACAAVLQAFAAVGTMEGGWFVATGAPRSFSEQQLIDCAWEQGPHGCDGGDYQPGFRWGQSDRVM